MRLVGVLLLLVGRCWDIQAFAVAAPRSARSFLPRRFVATGDPTVVDATTKTPPRLLAAVQQVAAAATVKRERVASDDEEANMSKLTAISELSPQRKELVPFSSSTDNTQQNNPSSSMPVWQGRAIVLFAAAIFGTNFATVKMMDESLPPSVSASIRFTLAAVAISSAVLFRQKQQKMVEPLSESAVSSQTDSNEFTQACIRGAEVGAWYLVGYLCQSYGLQEVAASKSAFFNALAVIVVPLLDAMFKGKQLGQKDMASVLIALCGVGLLKLGPAFASGTSDVLAFTHGDVLCLLQATFFGIGYWRLEKASSMFPKQAGLITAAQLVALSIGATLFATLHGDLTNIPSLVQALHEPFVQASLVWTGLVSTALALYLETVALAVVSASELTVLMTSVSLWGSAFAYMTMGEILPPIGWVGGLLILGGCALTAQKEQGKEA